MKKENINNLIIGCSRQMRADGYSEECVMRHLKLWHRGVLSYMKTIGAKSFTTEIGEDFLSHCKKNKSHSTIEVYKRNIHLLEYFLETRKTCSRIVKLSEYPLEGEIGDVALLFLESLREKRLSKRTIHVKRNFLSQFVTGLSHKGIYKVHDITVDSVIAAVDYSQINKEGRLEALRQFCVFLHEEGYIQENIGLALRSMRFPRCEKLPSVYTPEEISLAEKSIERSSAVGKRNYAIFLVASRLGMRASDIAALTWSNIDWDECKLTLYQYKTGSPIVLPLLRDVGEALVTYARDARPKPTHNEVFLSAKSPYVPMTGISIGCVIGRIMQTSGINIGNRHFCAHSLRHSLASNLLRQGIPMPTITAVLGHKNPQTTMEYLRIDIESLKRGMLLDAPPVDETFYTQKGGFFYE